MVHEWLVSQLKARCLSAQAYVLRLLPSLVDALESRISGVIIQRKKKLVFRLSDPSDEVLRLNLSAETLELLSLIQKHSLALFCRPFLLHPIK